MYVYFDKNGTVRAISNDLFEITGCARVESPDLPKSVWPRIIGNNVTLKNRSPQRRLRVAVICNWNQSCGISTYSRYLVEAMRPKVDELRIFSEYSALDPEPDVVQCWARGKSMAGAIEAVKRWKPNLVIVQHEFGIFPRATHFLQMLQMLENIPYVVTLHSVYEHLDKSVCTSAIKNIVVHSEAGREVLQKMGNNSRIFVIPHGCVQFKDTEPLWNMFGVEYSLLQMGFGFQYKGVDVALEAVAHLKKTQPNKYKDIFYCYLCSENEHTTRVHQEYYNFLQGKVEELALQDNVVIIRKFQTDESLNNYLRTAKLAVFPYVTDPNNTVYGASGAIRIAMANGTPVIASQSHLFDDLEGILPRPGNAEALAAEIDKVFSNAKYRQSILDKSVKFIADNTWDNIADRYLALYKEIS